MAVYYYRKYLSISLKTGISIPKNTCDRGLTLYHYGSIVVNAACQIGKNCCIMNNVNIGANQGSLKAPIIGDNVELALGCKIIGKVKIGDNAKIAPNSVVIRNVPANASAFGVFAKTIKLDDI